MAACETAGRSNHEFSTGFTAEGTSYLLTADYVSNAVCVRGHLRLFAF